MLYDVSMNRYFIYSRKSTEDEDRQILSIDAQLSELNMIARHNGLSVVQTFTESKSAKGPGREVFNEMIKRIERGEATAILTWKLDRLARNFDDGGKIIGLLQRGVIKEIRTFEKVYLPNDNVLMIAVELGMANQYVRDLSVNIQRGIREKVRRGIYFGKAPLGYYNEPRLRTIEPHPQYFDKVKRFLEMFATGKYTLTAMRKMMGVQGILGERSKKPLPISSIEKVLQNPFYYGVFLHKGEMHQGVHVPMITKQTFDKIQAACIAVGKPRNRNSRGPKGFEYLNFATCGSCGYAITAERHTKKSGRQYFYYRCTQKNKKHPCNDRTFIREEKFREEVRRNVELAAIPDEWYEKFLVQIESWESEVSTTNQAQIERLKGQLAEVKAKIDRINTGFTEGSIDITEFKELKNPLVPVKTDLDQRVVALEGSRSNRLEPLRNFIFEANQAQKWLCENNSTEMNSFLKKVGSNRLLRSQTLTVTFTKPFDSLAETVIAVRSTNDFSEPSSKWWRRRELNPRPKSTNQPRLHA